MAIESWKTILKKLPVSIAYHRIVVDEHNNVCDYEFVDCNPAFAQMIGNNPKDVIGKRLTEIMSGMEERDFDWIRLYAEIESDRDSQDIERHEEIMDRWYRITADFPEQGYLITYFVDITTEKIQLEELARQSGLIMLLLDSIPDIVFFKDTNGVYLGCNPSFAEFVGKSRREIIGKNDFELFGYEVGEQFRYHDQETMLLQAPRHNEEWITYPDGTRILLDTLKTPYRNGDSNIIGILGISRDITERKQVEEALRESETNFRNFFETIDDMIFIANQQGQIFFTNSAVSQKLGYSIDELITMHILDVHPEAKRQEAEHIFGEMFAGRLETCPLPLKRKDGSLVPVETRVWFGKWNGRDCLFGISKDLSKEQEALQRFNKIFESNPALMAISSVSDRKFQEVNRIFLEKLGYTRDEVIGRTYQDLDLFPQPERQLQVIKDLESQGRIHNVELLVKTRTGELLNGLLSGEFIESQGQHYFLTVMTDITQLKRYEKELQDTNARLEESVMKAQALASQAEAASVAKSSFLANMSHEIRTPMNGILGFIHLLENTVLNEEQTEYINTIKDSTDVLLTLINDVLDVSKIEAGKMELESIVFDIRAAMEGAVLPLEVRAKEKGLQINRLVHSEVPRLAKGDPTRLKQVITNLVGNAVKFTRQGEVLIEVELFNRCEESSQIKFTIRDTGIGIPDDAIPFLFQPFSQADSSSTRRFGGTGLGLSISKSIVEMMGGGISVASVEGEGSAFTFFVTVENVSDHDIEEPGSLDFTMLSGQRVVVVDENPTNRNIAKIYLQEAGCTVIEAANATEALAMLVRSGQPQVNAVLVDYNMPDMTGYELAAALKIVPATREIPLVLLTSLAIIGEARQAREKGFSGYLSKPYKRRELLGCLAMVLRRGAESDYSGKTLITRHSAFEESFNDRMKILLVEDNKVNRLFLTKILQSKGLNCDIAVDGYEALKSCTENRYDLVLMDCQMPVMDGYEATRRIREAEAGRRHTPIIAMTAYAMAGDAERCMAAGMDEYLSKPVDVGRLMQLIQKYAVFSGENPSAYYEEIIDRLEQEYEMERHEAEELLSEGLLEIVELLAKADDLIRAEDSEASQQVFHQLKGVASNLQMPELAGHLQQAEHAARSGDTARVGTFINHVRTIMSRFLV